MKTIIFILTLLFSSNLFFGQTADKQVKTDTVVYRLLKCGLYLGSNGDIGYRTNDNLNKRTRYITWIYGADQKDSINGGLKEMKYVIDTASFQFIDNLHWADKNNNYDFNPMSDGGTIYLSSKTDRKNLIIQTLILNYNAISCTCAQWSESKYNNQTDKREYFYLERANDNLINADTLFDGENFPVQIKVKGYVISERGYPKDYNPPKGKGDPDKVFRYTEIVVLQNGQKKTSR